MRRRSGASRGGGSVLDAAGADYSSLTHGAPKRRRYSCGVRPVADLKAREKCCGDDKPSAAAIEAALARLPARPDCAIQMRSAVAYA